MSATFGNHGTGVVWVLCPPRGLGTINALGSGKRGLLAAGGNIGPAKSRPRQLAVHPSP